MLVSMDRDDQRFPGIYHGRNGQNATSRLAMQDRSCRVFEGNRDNPDAIDEIRVQG